MFWTGGQLSRFAARQGREPDVAVGHVLGFVRAGDHVGDPLVVRGDLGFAEALSAEEIVELERAPPVRGEGGHPGRDGQEAPETESQLPNAACEEAPVNHGPKQAKNRAQCQADANQFHASRGDLTPDAAGSRLAA